VRDIAFWNQPEIRKDLQDTLQFMSGDLSYQFTFSGGHHTDPVDLFDNEQFHVDANERTEVMLFSGGLDSLAGAVEKLGSVDSDKLCLVSHQSGQPGTARTQNQLVASLMQAFPNRVRHYRFSSGLRTTHAREETQRTRFFLYSAVAFVVATVFQQQRFFVFENGVTSMNLPRRQDAVNARASRTTHPKTIGLLAALLSKIAETPFNIEAPFFWKTKTEVLHALKRSTQVNLIGSSVSCSKTFQSFELSQQSTHCGVCYQCIDRRTAAFSSGLADIDLSSLYHVDFVTTPLPNRESKAAVVGYFNQAIEFDNLHVDAMRMRYFSEFAEIMDYISGANEAEKVLALIDICKRHARNVVDALSAMRNMHDNVARPLPSGCLLDLISRREHLREPVDLLVDDISQKLVRGIPIMYQKDKPQNENRLNDGIQSLLVSDKVQFDREFPAFRFASGRTVPDHSSVAHRLLIEAKYPRKGMSKAALTDQIAADLVKYPNEHRILFVIYDPFRKISDDVTFSSDICTRDPRARVLIVR
jgi:hypothetical protein